MLSLPLSFNLICPTVLTPLSITLYPLNVWEIVSRYRQLWYHRDFMLINIQEESSKETANTNKEQRRKRKNTALRRTWKVILTLSHHIYKKPVSCKRRCEVLDIMKVVALTKCFTGSCCGRKLSRVWLRFDTLLSCSISP